jgi:hypothetical protein
MRTNILHKISKIAILNVDFYDIHAYTDEKYFPKYLLVRINNLRASTKSLVLDAALIE